MRSIFASIVRSIVRSIVPGIVALTALLVLGAPSVEADTLGAQPEASAGGRLASARVEVGAIYTLRVSTAGESDGGFFKVATPCVPAIATHTNASFDGDTYVAQQGFAETEIAAQSYVLTAADFPLRVDALEMIFYGDTTVETTTEWSAMIWRGLPSTGTNLLTLSSDGISVPHLVLPPGNEGANVQVFIDPGDPIIVTDDGTHTFSIGYRIDAHNNPAANQCTAASPANSNVFPCTDVTGLQSSTGNWLKGLNCGLFGCPPNGGWARFSALSAGCRPSGDWVMRATYMPSFATAEVSNVTCQDGIDNDCDGFTDCDDPNCGADSICALVGVGNPGDAESAPGALGLSVTSPLPPAGEEIRFTLPFAGRARVELYDASGEIVARLLDASRPAGPQSVAWDGRGNDGARVAPGVFFVRLADDRGNFAVRKLVIIR